MYEINKVRKECSKLMSVLTEDAKNAEKELKNAKLIQDEAFEDKARETKRREEAERRLLAL